MERKLTTIMAGDVVGYSRMMAEDEESTYTQWRDALREIVEPTLQRHGGRTFKSTGDGFLASFSSVNEALDAAIAIQDGFTTRALRLRIGLNLGDVIEENGDTFGDGVNIAARLESIAAPGSIYVSAAVVRSADKNRREFFERPKLLGLSLFAGGGGGALRLISVIAQVRRESHIISEA